MDSSAPKHYQVVYSPNQKFTVVLALKTELKDVWAGTSHAADRLMNHLLGKQIMLNRKNTLQMRRASVTGRLTMTLNSDKSGASKAVDMRNSLRLMPTNLMMSALQQPRGFNIGAEAESMMDSDQDQLESDEDNGDEESQNQYAKVSRGSMMLIKNQTLGRIQEEE